MKQEFYMSSSDGLNRIHGVIWEPEGRVRAVLQITHGMAEHIQRYHDFAEYLNEYGIAVIGHDHLGHGGSVKSMEDLGFAGEKKGKIYLLRDMHNVTKRAKSEFPDVPVFILGHSMGSFYLRRYITCWGAEIQGAIIMGTGSQPYALARFAKGLAQILKLVKGPRHRSSLLYKMTIGGYESSFGTKKRPGSWLTRDDDIVKAYQEDPYCGFPFTVAAYHDLFSLLADLGRRKDFDKIPRNLPIYLVSGLEDPVGDFSKGVLNVYNEYTAMDMEDVDIKFYLYNRHEILNELDNQEVYGDIRAWIQARLQA